MRRLDNVEVRVTNTIWRPTRALVLDRVSDSSGNYVSRVNDRIWIRCMPLETQLRRVHARVHNVLVGAA